MNTRLFHQSESRQAQACRDFLQIKTPSFAARGRVITFNLPRPGVRARFKCAESVSWLSRCHKDIVDVLVVAGIHREDGDVRAVLEQVLVEVCSE